MESDVVRAYTSYTGHCSKSSCRNLHLHQRMAPKEDGGQISLQRSGCPLTDSVSPWEAKVRPPKNTETLLCIRICRKELACDLEEEEQGE